ncbi:alpha/beta hydrolase [Alcaligenes sp. A-TC2]|uniref:alpha/beta hydrolase n=1 Tax=Alcaligenes nematophilus TaxID=2994643 RepID=UPI0022509DA2|nr:alpha/beta hydrolase [Alcaligenes nematophilus]MCX5471021.1 alpha/beta hydrolase [Alcaligenes nematophilus]
MTSLPRFLISAATLCLAFTLPSHAQQTQRPWNEAAGPSIVDQQQSLYRFETLIMSSEDGKRHYKIQIGTPNRPAPARGHPVIYMVDGNAAMASIDVDDLRAISALSAPVLVAVGYDTEARHDVIARAFDYTPPVTENGVSKPVEVRGRSGGGADIFLDYIETHIKPAVEEREPIDRSRQTLWGHSYGGLFALHTLFTHPDLYQRYVAGDPSLWWYDGILVKTAQAFDTTLAKDKRIAIMVGGQRRSTSMSNDAAAQWSAQDMAKHLQDAGLNVSYENFSDLNHGQMLAASLKPALRLAAQP